MEFDKLWSVIRQELPCRIKLKKGLSVFALNRSKFEGWLKVEICDVLFEYSKNLRVEEGFVDILFEEWFIELKTVNTSYRFNEIENKTKPITKNIESIEKDIMKLSKKEGKKAVLFVVFPLDERKEWNYHISKIKEKCKILKEEPFEFFNSIKAKLYMGLVE